jgi:hypothetical protein
MNSSSIDHMDGNTLACSPKNSDKDFDQICFYMRHILGPLLLIVASSLLYVAYLEMLHYRSFVRSRTAQVGGRRAPKRRTKSQMPVPLKPSKLVTSTHKTRRNPTLHGAQSAALVATGVFSVGISFVISGNGTAYSTDNVKGILGDFICK